MMNDYRSENHLLPTTTQSRAPGLAAPSSHVDDPSQVSLAAPSHEPFPQPLFDYQRRDTFDPPYQHQQQDERFSYAQSSCTRASFDKVASKGMDTPLEHAEECLSFAPPHSMYTLLDESYKPVDILLSVQLSGLFSREGQLSDYLGPDNSSSVLCNSPVIICYRRNRISISGHLAVPRGLRCVLTSQGQQLPILSQELVLSAFESLDDGHGGRLVQTLVQRDGPQTTATDSDGEGGGPQPIPLTPEAAEEATYDQEYTIFPFDWKKLQFRRATVNNGKGPDRQKFFYVSVKILATLADGQKVSICEASSNPIIVRGRGPQNFAKGPSSPEIGRVPRSRSVSATLDGRLRKPDRRSTRNSLLRQSLSRRPMLGSAAASAALQSISAYETSATLTATAAVSEAPISPPITPFVNLAQKREAEQDSRSSLAPEGSSPEPAFKLPSARSNLLMQQKYSSMPSKDEFDEMLKQNFDLPSSGLQILTPLTPPRPENSFGGDVRFPSAFNTNRDVAMTSDRGDSTRPSSNPRSNPLNISNDPSTHLPATPASQAEDADPSRVSSAPPMDMSYLDGTYIRDDTFLMLPGVSSPPSMDGNNLMASFTSMQDTSAWGAPMHNQDSDLPPTTSPGWAFS